MAQFHPIAGEKTEVLQLRLLQEIIVCLIIKHQLSRVMGGNEFKSCIRLQHDGEIAQGWNREALSLPLGADFLPYFFYRNDHIPVSGEDPLCFIQASLVHRTSWDFFAQSTL